MVQLWKETSALNPLSIVFWPNSICNHLHKCLLHYWLIQKYSTPGETKIIHYLHLSWQNNLCSMLFINKMGVWVKITLWNLYSWRMLSFYRLKYPCQIRSQHCYWCPVSLYCKCNHQAWYWLYETSSLFDQGEFLWNKFNIIVFVITLFFI